MKKLKTAVAAAAAILFALTSVFAAADADAIAARHLIKLWSFESGTTEGWHGTAKFAKSCSVNSNPEYVSEGKYSLKIDATGSVDWNQDIAVNDGPFPPEIQKLVELTMDVFIPAASIKGLEYQEMYLVFSSKANAWYQLKHPLNPGKNSCKFKVMTNSIAGDMWHIYIVLNNSQPYKGPIYVDNVVAKVMGEPGKLKGKVTDKATGNGLGNALVVVGDVLAKTNGSGDFEMTVPEDVHKLEVVLFGYRKLSRSSVIVEANKTADIGQLALVADKAPKVQEVSVNINASKVLRTIDPHKMYGHNLAAWHKPEGYRDNEAMQKIVKLGASFIRIPGGDYGNLYDWKTGDVYKLDGSVNWTPELNYLGGMVPFMKRLDGMVGGKAEVLPIINIMTPASRTIGQRIDYAIEWIQDMKNKGLKIRYVEVGNEFDNKPDSPGPSKAVKNIFAAPTDKKVKRWWTSIDNYSKVFNMASYKIKTAFKGDNLQLMGPCPMQPMNQQRIEGEPWKAEKDAPYWVARFLQNSAKYVDVLSIHEYPLWANNDARALLAKPQTTWPVYMPKYKAWMKKYLGKEIPVALTEWNSGDENIMTAKIENALFAADYLGSYIKEGGEMAFVWDLYTQKPGLGGGHGMMDAENDPTSKFSERAHYWVMMMYAQQFGTKLVDCVSDNKDLSVYASLTDDNKIAIMAINKTGLRSCNATINIAGSGAGSGKAYTLSEKEYVWSAPLYRPIINSGPSVKDINAGSNFTYEFPPYSVTMLVLNR